MKNSIILISIGIANILHASLHLIQFLQSIIIIGYSAENPMIEKILHNPIFAFIWSLVGLLTLIIGIKDYIHHHKHKD